MVTVTVQVDSHATPWDPTLNPSFDFGVNDHSSPVLIDEGFDFSVGNIFTITHLSGAVNAGGAFALVDANGDPSYVTNDAGGSSGTGFPSRYMPDDWDTYLMALVGTFADARGVIVGNPFEVGNGPTDVQVPSGASQLQLGINDDIFRDNSGSFEVSVQGTAVPIPGALWLLVAGLISITGAKFSKSSGKFDLMD
jgi:hypothetical protein